MLNPAEYLRSKKEAAQEKRYREFDPLVPEIPVYPKVKALCRLIQGACGACLTPIAFLKDKFLPSESEKLEAVNHEAGHLLIGAMKDTFPIRNAWVSQNPDTTSGMGIPGGFVTNDSISPVSILKTSTTAKTMKSLLTGKDGSQDLEPDSLKDEEIVDLVLVLLAGNITAKGLQDIDEEEKDPMRKMFFSRAIGDFTEIRKILGSHQRYDRNSEAIMNNLYHALKEFFADPDVATVFTILRDELLISGKIECETEEELREKIRAMCEKHASSAGKFEKVIEKHAKLKAKCLQILQNHSPLSSQHDLH